MAVPLAGVSLARPFWVFPSLGLGGGGSRSRGMCCVCGFYIVFSLAFPPAIAGSACLGMLLMQSLGLSLALSSVAPRSLSSPGLVSLSPGLRGGGRCPSLMCGVLLPFGLGSGWEFPLDSSLPPLHLLLVSFFVFFFLLLPTWCALGWCLFFPPWRAFQPSLFGLVLPGLPLSSPPFCRCGRCHSFLLLRPLSLLLSFF